MAKAVKPKAKVEGDKQDKFVETTETVTPQPTVETTEFKEEYLDAPGVKTATVTTQRSADVLHSSADSNKLGFIHNLVSGLVVKLSHQAALDICKSDPSKYVLATDEQIKQYKANSNGETNE